MNDEWTLWCIKMITLFIRIYENLWIAEEFILTELNRAPFDDRDKNLSYESLQIVVKQQFRCRQED